MAESKSSSSSVVGIPPMIGLAHGSRDPRVPGEIDALLAAVARRRPGLVAVPAFLDLTDPDLTATARALSTPTAVVVPLLFTAAFHTRVDTPAAVAAAHEATGVDLVVAGHLGTGDDVLAALRRQAERSGVADRDDILLLAVGSSDPAANDDVAGLAARWAAQRPGTVSAAFATTEPRATDSLAEPGRRGVVVPLFVASGLLLTAVERTAPDDVRVFDPLGDLLTDIVLARYDAAIRGTL